MSNESTRYLFYNYGTCYQHGSKAKHKIRPNRANNVNEQQKIFHLKSSGTPLILHLIDGKYYCKTIML